MINDFEYDIAFSFNALDEGIATQLNDLLSPRLKTFIYSERQREVAGTDGQERFSEVYGKTARLVVVLFRPEARVAELGGSPREETVVERADRFARAAKIKQKQEEFQSSDTGVKAALQAYEDFSLAIEKDAKAIAAAGIKIEVKRSQEYRILTGLPPCNAVCSFRPFYTNVLKDVFLRVDVYKGFPDLPGFMPPWDKPGKLKSLRYAYRLVRPDYQAWVGIEEKGREFTPQQLAEHVLRAYMDIAEHTKAD